MRLRRIVALLALVALGVAGVAGYRGVQRMDQFSERVSGRGLFASELGARAGDSDRFNLLVLGYGGAAHQGANLTDSILIYSAPLDGGEAAQISLPRDFWIEGTPGRDDFMKINAVYAAARNAGKTGRQAASIAARSIGAAVGVPVHGWLTVDFDGFRDLVDALGGVEVDVQRAFSARYPRNDDPKKDHRWMTVRFEKGPQEMDGATAMRYARARYSANPKEGSDFARASRQQRLVAAIKRKLLSPAGVLAHGRIASAVEDDIRTNVSIGDLARLFRAGVDERRSVVLGEGNVLAADTTEGGQYILVPRDGDWDALHRFVRSSLEAPATARK